MKHLRLTLFSLLLISLFLILGGCAKKESTREIDMTFSGVWMTQDGRLTDKKSHVSIRGKIPAEYAVKLDSARCDLEFVWSEDVAYLNTGIQSIATIFPTKKYSLSVNCIYGTHPYENKEHLPQIYDFLLMPDEGLLCFVIESRTLFFVASTDPNTITADKLTDCIDIFEKITGGYYLSAVN